MSFFDTTTENHKVRVTVTPFWFFYIWVLEYDGPKIFEASGFALSETKALDKLINRLNRIVAYEGRTNG